jgi:uncharacterized protein (DUF2252 family)
MDENQLIKAREIWGFSMEITLRNGNIYVANEGFVTDNIDHITAKTRYGKFKGLYYQYRRKGTRNELTDVILAIVGENKIGDCFVREVTA